MIETDARALTLARAAQWSGADLAVPAVAGGSAGADELLARPVQGAAIDTRALEPGMLFVPLPGSRHDGHEFVGEALAHGAAAALCARERAAEWLERGAGPLLVVDDVTVALAQLAHAHRRAWPGLLVAVTGSSGKTTTRELVAAALATAGPVLATTGNLNNQWGLPLTLLRLAPGHRAAVVELGANHPGEIADLARIAAPGAAVITNAGTAHLEGFGSLGAIAREKASLGFALEPGRPLFAGADSPRLLAALRGVRARLVTYGLSRAAAVRPRDVWDLGADGSRLEVDGFPALHLRLVGRHQVANALAALAVARTLGLDAAAVARALERVRPVGARMEVRRVRGATLLVDCYNANPDSTRAALETLAAWPAAAGRLAVLGDMLELGPRAAALHRATGARVRGAALWTTGAHAADLAAGARRAGAPVRVFADKPALAAALRAALAPGVVALLKASRGAALEQVLAGLEERG